MRRLCRLVNDFFSAYAHEMLSDAAAGTSIPASLRSWFVLPYIEEPEKDHEFAAYFTAAWSEMLKITLHNFLSVVLSSAPPPKLLLLERWFRSEAQQEIRAELKFSAKKIDSLIHRVEEQEERLHKLRETIKDLASALLLQLIQPDKEFLEADNESSRERRVKSKELGIAVAECAVTCLKHKAHLQSLPYEQRLLRYLGAECSSMLMRQSAILSDSSVNFDHFPDWTDVGLASNGRHPSSHINHINQSVEDGSMELLEVKLVRSVQLWIESLS